MNGFEINKIIASIILGVMLVFGVGKFTDWLFYVEKPETPSYTMRLHKPKWQALINQPLVLLI